MKKINFNGRELQAFEPSDEQAKQYIGKEVFIRSADEHFVLCILKGVGSHFDTETGFFGRYMLPIFAVIPQQFPQQFPEPDWNNAPELADIARNVLVFSVKDQEYDELSEEWSFDPCGTVDEKWKVLGPIYERPKPKELTREEKKFFIKDRSYNIWEALSITVAQLDDESLWDQAYEKMRTK